MSQLTDNIYAFEVPDDLLLPEYCFDKSIGHMLNNGKGDDEFVIRHRERSCGSPIGRITIDLPPSTWRFLFTTKTATEEDARKVVKQLNNGVYHDYARSHFDPCDEYASCYLTATESLASLFRSKNLDPKNNYALIEKQSSDGTE